jgi:hypothetical protein
MKTLNTLVLAGLAALSLSAGTALAQEGGPSMPGPGDYWTQHDRALYAHQAPAPTAPRIQSGSSDVTAPVPGSQSGWIGDKSPYRFDYGTLADPG